MAFFSVRRMSTNSKGASDMVLVNDDFTNIIDAVEGGRTIYNNIAKFVYFLLSTNVAEVFLILIAVCMGLQSPLTPIQILWLNLTTDGLPAIALAMEETEPQVMMMGPRPRSEPIIEKVMITGVVIQTFFLTSICLACYITGLYWENDTWDGVNSSLTDDEQQEGMQKAQTMTIYLIVFAELFRAYGARSLRESIFTIGVFTNAFMQYSVAGSLLLTVGLGHIPGLMDIANMHYLDGRAWALILGLSVIPIIVDEITKIVYRKTGFGKREVTDKASEHMKNQDQVFHKRGEDGTKTYPYLVSPKAEVAPNPKQNSN